MRLLYLALALLVSVWAMGQSSSGPDHILLMNGEIIRTKVLGQSTLEVRYLEFGKNGRTKERAEPTETVFSVTDSLGRERIWYFMDTVFGNELTIPQMRWYMEGERDARKGYKPLVPMLLGFVAGAAPVLALDLEVNSLLIPPVYAGLMAWPRVNVTRGSIRDPSMEGDPNYAMGYAAAGRPKRVLKCLASSFIGVGVGLAIRQLIINPNLDQTY